MAGKKRILMLEDNYDSLRYLKEHLEERMSWEVLLTAERGLLERLRHERFDLILVDLMIETTGRSAQGGEVQNIHFDGVNWRATGMEFIRRLRKGEFSSEDGQGTASDVPVVVLSAVADSWPESSTGTSLPGVAAYVEKPFRLRELVSLICQLLKEGGDGCRAS